MMYYVACGLALVATLGSLGCSPRVKRQELTAEAQQLRQFSLGRQLVEEELLLELPDSLDLVPPLRSAGISLPLHAASAAPLRSSHRQARLYYQRRTRAVRQQAASSTQSRETLQQLRQEPRRQAHRWLLPLGLALGAGLGVYLSHRLRRALR
nr:hypothetical protein [uncultured Porphyromonas sp.]